MSEEYSNEKVVIAHVAENATEALVIRGLLESAGIQSPGSVSTDPFPIPENPEGPHNKIFAEGGFSVAFPPPGCDVFQEDSLV